MPRDFNYENVQKEVETLLDNRTGENKSNTADVISACNAIDSKTGVEVKKINQGLDSLERNINKHIDSVDDQLKKHTKAKPLLFGKKEHAAKTNRLTKKLADAKKERSIAKTVRSKMNVGAEAKRLAQRSLPVESGIINRYLKDKDQKQRAEKQRSNKQRSEKQSISRVARESTRSR